MKMKPDDNLVHFVRDSIVGENDAVLTTLGARKITYLDHTASARTVGFIEEYVAQEVAPLYGNTHTTTSATGLTSHGFLSEARAIIRDAVNGSEVEDCALFAGRGATGASNMLVHFLVRPSQTISTGVHSACAIRPVHVVIGPWLHHSSLLPWKEAGPHVTVHMLRQDGPTIKSTGDPAADAAAWQKALLAELHDTLASIQAATTANAAQDPAAPPPRIVSVFTAASNVTGAMLTEGVMDAVCALVHSVGGIACFDLAAYIPHCATNMNPGRVMSVADALALRFHPSSQPKAVAAASSVTQDTAAAANAGAGAEAAFFSCARDALYFSAHKLTGGVSGPGVLVLKRQLMVPVPMTSPRGEEAEFASSAMAGIARSSSTMAMATAAAAAAAGSSSLPSGVCAPSSGSTGGGGPSSPHAQTATNGSGIVHLHGFSKGTVPSTPGGGTVLFVGA